MELILWIACLFLLNTWILALPLVHNVHVLCNSCQDDQSVLPTVLSSISTSFMPSRRASMVSAKL